MSQKIPSHEFLKFFEKLWKEGPIVKYQNPEAWNNPEAYRLPF